MTKEELNYIKDAFSQIIEDIAGNPDWHEVARSVASDLGTLERELEEKVASLPSNLDEAAELSANGAVISRQSSMDGRVVYNLNEKCFNHEDLVRQFKVGAEWQREEDNKKHCFVQLTDIKKAWKKLKEMNQEIEDKPSVCFYKGAEWMAGQGASFNTKVGWIDGPTILDWPDNILDGFKMGDEVIVQIRKK